MKKRKLTALLLTVSMAASMVAGCSGNKTDTPQTTKTEEAGTKETESADEEKTTINIWSITLDTKEEVEAFKEAFAATEAGKNIEVTFEEIPAGTNQEKSDALLTNLIGDGGIDIFDANLSEYFNFASKGMFEDLTSYAEADGFDLNKVGKDNVELSKINGSLYALPYIQSAWLLYYNKNLFDEAGIAYPSDDMTWDEFREIAKQLTKGEGPDKQWGFTMPDWSCTWAGIATQNGIGFIKEDGTVNLDDPAFKEALQYKYDLTMVDQSGPSLAENTVTKSHYAKQFCNGNVAMLVGGDWVHTNIRENLQGNYTFEYDVASIPHPEGVAAGTTYGAPRYIGINAKRTEAQKKAAWEVIKFMAGEETARILVEKSGTLPAVVTDELSDIYTSSLPEFVTNGAIVFREHKHVEEKPYHVASGQIDSIMTEEAQLFLTDAQDLDKTIENMVRRSNDEIKIVLDSLNQ